MGLIEKFERRLERLVNGAFSKAFKSQIQPIEIGSAIKAKLDKSAAVVNKDQILAPNQFTVRLSPTDFNRLKQLGDSLVTELHKQVASHAKRQRYQFAGALEITVEASSTLGLGQIQVSAAGTKNNEVESVAWAPALDFGGKRYVLAKARTTVGRDNSADIQVDDSGLSRTHFAIIWDGSKASIEDLGSTNGTKISGVKISSQPLPADTAISAGRTDFVFRIIAKNKGDA